MRDRRHILTLLTFMTTALFALPAGAQTDIASQIQTIKEQMQSTKGFFTSTEMVSGGGFTLPGYGTIPVPIGYYVDASGYGTGNRGFLGYVDDFPPGVSFLNDPSPDPANDFYYTSSGQGARDAKDVITYWDGQCFMTLTLMDDYLAVVDKAQEALTMEGISDASKTKLLQISRTAQEGVSKAATMLSPHPCMAFAADVYYALFRASDTGEGITNPNANKAVCLANWFIDKTHSPDPNEDGVCEIRNLPIWNWGTPTNCVGSTCRELSIALKSAGEETPKWYPYLTYYSPRPTFSNPVGTDTLLVWKDAAQAAIASLNSQLKDLGVEIDKEAAAQKEELAKQTAAAQAELNKGSVIGLSLPLSDITIPEFIKRVINQILGIVGALGLVMFIYGGFLYMTASGNEQRAANGQKALIWSTLGLVVIFAAYAIVNFLLTALTTSV